MPDHQGVMVNRVRRLLLLGFVGLLGACQSTTEALDSAAVDQPAVETLGEGETVVALLIARSAGGEQGREASEQRNGAALALRDLGGGQLALTVLDTGSTPAGAVERAREAVEAGASLVIGPSNAAGFAEILSDIPAGERRPLIGLVSNASRADAASFTFISDEIDSAVEVAGYAIGAGHKDIVAITAPGTASTLSQRLGRGIQRHGGSLIGVIEYADPESLTAESIALLRRADALLILAGDNNTPMAALPAIRATEALSADAMLLGTMSWPRQHHDNPMFRGFHIPLLDQSGLRNVSARSSGGRPLSTHAAYAYDAVALAAGLVRSAGSEALTVNGLKRDAGFRGATGAFRFEADGSVYRPFAIHRIENGGLRLVDPAPEGF